MSASSRYRGFTLIELLVTVVIIGVVSIATLSLSLAGDDRDIRREAQRLMSLVEVARDDAVLQGREFGIEFLLSSYRFVEYDPVSGLWLEILGEDLLRTRVLPEDLELTLFLEEKRVTLEEDPVEIAVDGDDKPTPAANNYAPHIFVFSSGDMTPFELQINRVTDQQSIVMQGDLLGNLELVSDEDKQL